MSRALLAALVLALGVSAQAPVGQRIPQLTASVREISQEATRVRLANGLAAAKDNERVALRHYLAALGFAPASPGTLRELLSFAQGDADARFLWALRWWRSLMDARGRVKTDRAQRKLLPAGGLHPGALGAARAAAIAELAAFAGKLGRKSAPGNSVLARWASDLGWELLRSSPGLQTRYAAAFNRACEEQAPDYELVLEALRKLMSASVATTSDASLDAPMRAARCLTGLGAQAGFKDLKGPEPPDMQGLASEARKTRARLRRKIARELEEPLTVELLEQFGPEEREAFSRAHATWASPAIGISPNGRYEVQTICGFETLLGALRTIELHHARLADWFGKDPFLRRRGLVRILPEASGLESEDSPFWWAGGFQSGDRTVLRFSWGSIAGLGRGLTHELTHRFDGAMYPGMPAWLVEGRAVWTGQAYQYIEDGSFIANFLRPWSVQTPFVKGYGGKEKLKKLIEGTIDDYRDNYSAGYALYAYLSSWEKKGKQLYAARLRHFMRHARSGRKDPLGFFVRHFADGKNGRPKGLDAFVTEWREFLSDCYKFAWGDKDPAWLARHTIRFPKRPGKSWRGLVMDEPTWSWSRHRAEPWFGEYQAARAGELLESRGHGRAAAAAFLWSLVTDGWEPGVTGRLGALLARLGRKDAAWVVRYECARRLPGSEDPGRSPLVARLPKLRSYLTMQQQTAARCLVAGMPLAARWLLAERNRLGRHLGLAEAGLPRLPASPSMRYPTREPPHRLGLFGWEETGLTGYEERRVAGLWFETEGGDLHVGRKKPHGGTGMLDRRAHQRHAFVRSAEWQEVGDYVFRTRVHFTTSFVAGAVILGYTRRDRNLRLHFSAGDFLYSIGRKEEAGKTKKMNLSWNGLWDREGRLSGSRPRRKFEFKRPSSSFLLELRVSGPSVRVYVQNEHVFSYTTPDLSPITGHIGVAMSQGAVRLQEPMVQRLDRASELVGPEAMTGLDPGKEEPATLKELLGRPVRGIPRSEHGTIVVWLPARVPDPAEQKPDEGAEAGLHQSRRSRIPELRHLDLALRMMKRLLDSPLHYPQLWVLAVPSRMAIREQRRLRALLKRRTQLAFDHIEHRRTKPFEKRPWILFVDAMGVLRAAARLGKGGGLPGNIERWARVYRTR
ncbi:MAG: hypothetical protein ACE5F1_12170 [Planctomycetota bacterium]